MKKSAILAAAALVLSFSLSAFAELLDDPQVQTCFYCVFADAGFGHKEIESAAWVLARNGQSVCQFWPSTAETDKQTFKGQIPFGIQALVHTHPNGKTFRPDDEADKKAAHQIHAPNYVVSSSGAWKYDPSNNSSKEVADYNFLIKLGKTLPKDTCKKIK